MKTVDIKRENEKKILKSIAIALWSLIALIVATSYVLKSVINTTDFRRLVFESTSLITQIQISSPEYGSLLFLLAFIGKILLLYIIYVLLAILTNTFKQTSTTESIFEDSYIEEENMILPKLNKSKILNNL